MKEVVWHKTSLNQNHRNELLKQCEKMGYLWASKTNELIDNPQSYQWTLQGSWKCIVGK